MGELDELLAVACAHALDYIKGLPQRDVALEVDRDAMIEALGPN